MNFSGRSVAAPSRVIEIEEVFDATRQAGFRLRDQRLEDLPLEILLFRRRLDHQVRIGERGVVGSGLDPCQRLVPLIAVMIERLT